MRCEVIAIALVGCLSAPLASAGGPLGTHAIRGIVLSVSATAVVIVRSGRSGSQMRFVVTPSTDCEGKLAIGRRVSIRYVQRGSTLVATAVASDP
jgi:hypothetical protein